jgi:moderate conductance mechanosensitive channel
MILSVTPLNDFSHWVRSSGLEIVMLVAGSVLLARLAAWIGGRITARIDARATEEDALVRSEETKHRHAVTQVITWAVVVLIYFVVGILVLQRFDVPLTTLVAPATVVGVALGFGAQRVVQDLLGGFFLIAERQYGFGDVIRIAPPGSTTGVTGTVEDLSLRMTRLRTANGEVLFLANGEIRQVTNLSRDWARAVIDVPVPVGADIGRVNAILRSVCDDAFSDPELRSLLLDTPTVMGIESLEVDHLAMRVVVRTLPGKQFEVGRQLRARIAAAFQAEGIRVPPAMTAPPPTEPA